MNYEEALECSNEITSLLFHYCMRIEPTGAVRRKEINVDSVEMIASPQVVVENRYWEDNATDLGGEIAGTNRLEAGIERLVGSAVLKKVHEGIDMTQHAQGETSPSYDLQYKKATVVIYLVMPPAEWGVEFLFRTGDDDFVDFLTERCTQKGFALNHGHLEKLGKPISTPEEADVLKALDLEWIEPENRKIKFRDLWHPLI